jgi:hypothetical protein
VGSDDSDSRLDGSGGSLGSAGSDGSCEPNNMQKMAIEKKTGRNVPEKSGTLEQKRKKLRDGSSSMSNRVPPPSPRVASYKGLNIQGRNSTEPLSVKLLP